MKSLRTPLGGEKGLAWLFFARLSVPESIVADGPTFADGMTNKMLQQEWNTALDEAIEVGAQAQAICMQTEGFRRADRVFAAKEEPALEGDWGGASTQGTRRTPPAAAADA